MQHCFSAPECGKWEQHKDPCYLPKRIKYHQSGNTEIHNSDGDHGLKNTWAINWNNLLQYKSKISYSTDKTDSNEWTGWKQKQILPKSTFYIRKTHLPLSILNYPKEISYFKYECSLFNLKKSKQDKNTNRDDNKFPRR